MKKTILTSVAAIALVFGGFAQAFAEEPCNGTASQCQAKEGFQTIGEGVENAAEGSYNTVKEGTVEVYGKTKEGAENAYEKTKNGTVNAYETVKNGTVETYEKTKNGIENFFENTKEKIHNATE